MSTEGVQKSGIHKMCLACNKEFEGDMATCPDDGTALIVLNTADPYVGTVVNDVYSVEEILGKGGMGIVYLARHTKLDRLVALKMLQAELNQDELSKGRFRQEAEAAAALSHPHLITLYDSGVVPEKKQPYLVMEYLEGVSLLEVLRHEGPMEPKRAVKIFSEAADGLAHAHKAGILHRDLKPSNILLINQNGDSDFVKIVDFGLAKLMPWSGKESQHLTKTGEVFGSPIYMSPEQCMGKELRPTSDIYSLGITLFEMLTGKPPFRGMNSIQTASKHMQDPVPRFADVRPDLPLPEGLEKVVMRCLAKDPIDRFQNMTDFKDALESGLNSDSVEMPASLMVSTRAIPAINPNSRPSSVQKAASSSTQRPITGMRAAAGKPALNPAVIGGVVGALAIAGGAAFYLLSPQPADSIGMMVYMNDDEFHVRKKNDTFDVIKRMPNADVVGIQMRPDVYHCGLGHNVKASYETNRLDSTKKLKALVETNVGIEPPTDQQAVDALYAVDDFLNRYTGRLDMEQKEGKKIGFNPSGHFLYIPNKLGSVIAQTSNELKKEMDERHQGDEKAGVSDRAAAAYKIGAVDHNRGVTTILVDPTFFLLGSKPDDAFWAFEVDRGGTLTNPEAKVAHFRVTTAKEWYQI